MTDVKAYEDLDAKTIRVLRITPSDRDGTVLARASVEFGLWITHGVRLMKRADGTRWLGMPARKNQDGEWIDVCFVPARAARERLLAAVEDAYHEQCGRDGAPPPDQREADHVAS